MISCQNLTFSYPDFSFNVLDQISLEVRKGETVSIMGANGSGKSTLVKCLNGLLLPTSGEVLIENFNTKNPGEIQNIRQIVGMVFQNPDNQIVSTTVEREIAFGLENLRIEFDEMHAIVNRFLKNFDLDKYKNKSPNRLSGGEKQLLALAAVLAMEPACLILDEPTSLLDPSSRKRILDYVFKYDNDLANPKTTLLITQYPEETLYTKRLIILSNGKILFDDEPKIVFNETKQLCELGIGAPLEYLLDLEEYSYEN